MEAWWCRRFGRPKRLLTAARFNGQKSRVELKIEFGITDDGTHIMQRVSLGNVTTSVAIPVAQARQVANALTQAWRNSASKVIVPGKSGVEYRDSALAAEDNDEQQAG